MKDRISNIKEESILQRLLDLGAIRKDDFGYVQAYDDECRLWSKKRAAMTLAIEFGYSPKSNHVSSAFLKKFDKISQEHMIHWEDLRNDSRAHTACSTRQATSKRLECEQALGFDNDRCDTTLRSNIQKRWLRIHYRIKNQEKLKRSIEHFRSFLRKKHPELYPDLTPVKPVRQVESLESILATSGALFSRFSNCNCDYDDKYGQSYDQALNEYCH